jgi:hypothetical protein
MAIIANVGINEYILDFSNNFRLARFKPFGFYPRAWAFFGG